METTRNALTDEQRRFFDITRELHRPKRKMRQNFTKK